MVANLLLTKNKEDKYTFNFPAEVLNSDPKGVERFKYSLKPYKGYYFTVANGNLNSRGEKSFYELDNRLEKRFYKGQEYELNPTKDTLAYIAYPVKKGDPTFYFKSGVVYMSNEPVEYFFPKYQLSKRDWLNLGNFFNRPYNLK